MLIRFIIVEIKWKQNIFSMSYGDVWTCVHKCSGVCFGDVACNRTTGKCDTGCDIGYTGVMCDTGMTKL